MSNTSSVAIEVSNPDGSSPVDLTRHALITGASFDVGANAQPQQCEVTMRDFDRSLSFITGQRIKLKIDDVPLWSGFLTLPGRGNFLPAGDAVTPTKTRKFTLTGVDNNILWDKRFLRNTSDYLKHVPYVTSDEYLGVTLKRALASYADMPSWLDIVSQIDNVALLSTETGRAITPVFDKTVPEGPWAYPSQGTKLRDTAEALAQICGAIYYIGPDDKVHFHAIQDTESPWGFSDRPNFAPISSPSGFEGAYWGFRELSADEDGTDFVTDALVWGGSEIAGTGGTVFYRATDPTLEAIHGKWQLAEAHVGETNFKLQLGVTQRANIIVFGNVSGDPSGAEPGSVPGEGPRGLRFPQWAYNFSWHTRNVPVLSGVPRHLYPGDLVNIQLWAFSEDGGVTPFSKFLPLRQVRISFPSGARDGSAVVRFDGGFDLRNIDSKFLWAYLRSRAGSLQTETLSVVNDTSTAAALGSLGQFVPTPATNGVATVFTVPFAYIPGTTELYLNGLIQRLGVDYTESNPDAGEITLTSAPVSTDNLFVICRTQAG